MTYTVCYIDKQGTFVMKVFLLGDKIIMAENSKKTPHVRKGETMRDKAQKATDKSAKPRRLNITASAVNRPLKAASVLGKKEFYLITPQEKGFRGFLTKRRRLTPSYLISSYKELREVSWPNRRETWKLMLSVFLFATVFGLLVTAVDFGLDKLFREAFL